MSARRIAAALWLASLTLALTGCGSGMGDLKEYVAQVKARKVTKVPPIPVMQPYVPFAYKPGDRRDPFVPQANDNAGAAGGSASNSGLHPDLSRPKDPLEAYPLDALRMVGTIDFRGKVYAMISAPDGVIHRVTRGEHMGQNFGAITRITPDEVDLSEIVPDGFGGWQRRAASLSLADNR